MRLSSGESVDVLLDTRRGAAPTIVIEARDAVGRSGPNTHAPEDANQLGTEVQRMARLAMINIGSGRKRETVKPMIQDVRSEPSEPSFEEDDQC